MLCLRFFYYAAFYLYYYRTQILIIIGHKYRPQDTKLTSAYLYDGNMHFSIRMAGLVPADILFGQPGTSVPTVRIIGLLTHIHNMPSPSQ